LRLKLMSSFFLFLQKTDDVLYTDIKVSYLYVDKDFPVEPDMPR